MKSIKSAAKHGSAALLTITLCSLAVPAAVQAQQDNQVQALRELNIMRNIFDAALEADNQQNRMRMGPPEAMYLAGQGMVFTFHLNGTSGFNFGEFGNLGNLGEQMEILASQLDQQAQAIPPVPPDVDVDADYDFDFDFDFDFDDGQNNEKESAYRNQLREMTEAMRERQQEMRDMQREIRDLAREERNDQDADNQAEIDRLSAELEARGQELQSQSTSMQQVQQQYQAERMAAFEAVRTRQTDLIFDTLCSYGNTLRSLGNDQHVNIVLRNYANDQTQVIVLDYADIANCASVPDLRQAAVSYLQNTNGF